MSELHTRIRKSTLHDRIMAAEEKHDLDVLVTERGLADLRGLCPQERARVISDKCVHPDCQPIMREYFERARRECCEMNVGHEPHMLFKVFKMQQSLAEEGTMKIDNWN